MKEIEKMGQEGRNGYIMAVGVLVCLLLLGLTVPLLASEFQATPKQHRLADHARLMYGLKKGAARNHKAKRAMGSTPARRPLQARSVTQKKGRLVAGKSVVSTRPGTALLASKSARFNSSHRLHQKKWSHPGRAHVVRGRHGKRSGTPAFAKRLHRTKSLFSASVERRMGTFMGPLNASAAPLSSGLFFRTPENASVMATSRGQVVYAGWFRGYGLLVILNHGGRVYSLYGHNHDLLVAKGDFVEPGQVIAKSGKTGSVDGIPGLYFEIRRGNRPENPRKWLVKNRWHSDKMASLAE
ncbi:MAG: M23 family metallopeptidase [Magnetococcales bacterium]|nr:M23 family metallopeptidase [Magnetococcales bacterium]